MTIRKLLMASLVLLAAGGVLLSVPSPASGRQNAVAALDPVQGLVQWRSAASTEADWKTITRAQLVEEGDWIRTDSLGLAYLTFFEGNETEILPDTVVHVARFDFVDADSPDIVIEVSVGAMHHQIEQALDAESRYEVHTPSASITVRGTDFWNSSTWQSDTTVSVLKGLLETQGIFANGTLGDPFFVGQNQSIGVTPAGQPQAVIPLDPSTLPNYPLRAPIAPETCGNGLCDPGEETVCALDCLTLPTCGNRICDSEAGESPVTCALDCVPPMRTEVEPSGSSSSSGNTSTQTQPVNTEPCTITANYGSVEIRVGPGFNRSVRDYLPTNQPIPVVGQNTDNSSVLWYKIQPPGYVPAEADRYWVNAADVTTAGNCDAIGDAAASAVVAPSNPQPPAGSSSSSTDPDLPPMSVSFYADSTQLSTGDCATLYWSVAGIREVYYQGQGVTGQGSRFECPYSTSNYTLTVLTVDGQTLNYTVTLYVDSYPY